MLAHGSNRLLNMKIMFFDDINSVGVAELENDLRRLPSWRRDKACAYRNLSDKILSVKAYLLLCHLLEEEYGISDAPEFLLGKNGKPHLKSNPDIHFNMSHCRAGAMCVVADYPVGCDIESTDNEPDTDMLSRCCNSSEATQIAVTKAPKEAFALLWTKKEAFLKLTGEGLNDNLPKLLESDEAKRTEFRSGINRECGYAYSICTYKD